MDAINIEAAPARKITGQHVLCILLALVFCTSVRISLLFIYPLLVLFLFYAFNWRLHRNALYIFSFTTLFWLLSFRDGVFLKYNAVSLYYFIPFVLLLFAEPTPSRSQRDYLKMLMYPLTAIAIVNNFFGFAQYIEYPNDDSFEGLYGTFTVSQNGLSLVNAILFFYHLCMYQRTRSNAFLVLSIFFMVSSVMGFYGAGLIAFLGAIILTYLRIRLRNILILTFSMAIILVLIYFVMKMVSPLTLDYNVNIIKKFLDPTAANAPRKLTIFRNYYEGYTADAADLLMGSGPGTFNSRSAFMVGSPTYFNVNFIKSDEQPHYFRNYAYTLWNPSNTGPYDGFMNQPFTSLLAIAGEYGLFIALCLLGLTMAKFRKFVKLISPVAREYRVTPELKMFRFCLIFALLLLIIDNYMEYPEILALLLIIVKLSQQNIRTAMSADN
jgi:hypothetical protein